MKFEDLLMQPIPNDDQQHQMRHLLEQQVEKLEAELVGEEALNKVLLCALNGPVSQLASLSSVLPPKAQALVAELALVEKEIILLEKKSEQLKLTLYQEKQRNHEIQIEHLQQQHDLPENDKDELHHRSRSHNNDNIRRKSYRKSSSELISIPPTSPNEELHQRSFKHRRSRIQYQFQINKEIDDNQKPNRLSEELIKCLIRIFLELNQSPSHKEGPSVAISCMKSKGFKSKALLNNKPSIFLNIDPYGILPETNCSIRDIGPYKNFIQITRSSVDITRISEYSTEIRKLRALIHKLRNVELTLLSYKQKLAFWINAFLEHGLPSTQEKLLALMNKAALNVGGVVLNALAIEHFILRHPNESKHGTMDEKEMLLRRAYGLGYPEPNVTFALCRGSWSSPALRLYIPDEVVNELGRAKVEYLEASIGITSRRKILVPKLLEWHMHDFAEDTESLVEWVYSQLPRSSSVKRLMIESLSRETKHPMSKMVEIQPYESEFRYLIPM
ncbi:hypothetical protein ACFE04_001213 [Oxalis oulophora]